MCDFCFFFSSRRRHTRWTGDWSSDVCSSDLLVTAMVVVRRGVVVSVVALVACLGVPSASAQSVAPPRLTWRPRAILEGSVVVLELSAPTGDSVTAVHGER